MTGSINVHSLTLSSKSFHSYDVQRVNVSYVKWLCHSARAILIVALSLRILREIIGKVHINLSESHLKTGSLRRVIYFTVGKNQLSNYMFWLKESVFFPPQKLIYMFPRILSTLSFCLINSAYSCYFLPRTVRTRFQAGKYLALK